MSHLVSPLCQTPERFNKFGSVDLLTVQSFGCWQSAPMTGYRFDIQDGTASIRVYALSANAPFYHGAHIFQRYQTEYDL